MEQIRNFGLVTIAYFLSAAFMLSGITKLMMLDMHVNMFAAFGLGTYALIAVGVQELVGGLMIAFRKTRVVGALLIAATMIGAGIVHVTTGVAVTTLPINCLFLGLAALIAHVSHVSNKTVT